MKATVLFVFVSILTHSIVYSMTSGEYAKGVRVLAYSDLPSAPGITNLRSELIEGVDEHFDLICDMRDEHIEDDGIASVLAFLVGESSLPKGRKNDFMRSLLVRDNPAGRKRSTISALKGWEGDVDREHLLRLLRSDSDVISYVAAEKAATSSKDSAVLREIEKLAAKERALGRDSRGEAFDKMADDLRGRLEVLGEEYDGNVGDPSESVQ